MKRFYKQPANKWGQVIILDYLNTEPVCCIYAKYHPYAPDIIMKALENYQNEIPMDKCKCGNDKPIEWLHCGCGQYNKKAGKR